MNAVPLYIYFSVLSVLPKLCMVCCETSAPPTVSFHFPLPTRENRGNSPSTREDYKGCGVSGKKANSK